MRYLYIYICAALLGFQTVTAQQQDKELGRSMETMINVMRDVSVYYVDSVQPQKLLKDATIGITMGLDPYTEWISASEMTDFEAMTRGEYGGIGALIRKKGAGVAVARPYEGSPAARAGLRAGDMFVEINDENVETSDTEHVTSLLRGTAGTKFSLKVRKLNGTEQTLEITRERIAIPAVPYSAMLEGGIGYIQHSDFSDGSAEELRRALVELRRQGTLSGLILDYRSNGGGILQEAVEILGMFVPRGTEVVSTRGRLAEMTESYKTAREPLDLTTPIVVLTNSASASAAEIVSGALQDLDRAVLLGQRTFGKGLVQSTVPAGYDSYMKITTAKYYIPSGRCIQAVDYARRNDDGSVRAVPDSLVREFHTRAGRKVYDGGGIMPDVVLEPEFLSLFTAQVVARGYIDDFCDRSGDAATFDYAEFAAWMADKPIEYESETRLALNELKARARRELHTDVVAQVDAIEKSLADDKAASLERYRQQLTEIIRDELLTRTGGTRAASAHRLGHDPEVAAAVELLRDRDRYNNMITKQDTARK